MINNNQVVFASSKLSTHQDRIEAYLRGENIYPITVELDLTQRCTLDCPACPYGSSKKPGLTLQLPFLEKFFSILGPYTPGIVFSGGESTCVPHFPETVKLAREKGFKEIVVISNGTLLHKPKIQEALLKYVNAIRISIYDWHETDEPSFKEMLEKIKNLRKRIDNEGSKLEIGAAMLTRTEWNRRYKSVGKQVLEAGVDWLYFHPFCVNWESNYPVQADQSGVVESLDEFKAEVVEKGKIQIPYERYLKHPLKFSKLHGSHFLIQIGADGINYAGPECKYNPNYALIDLNKNLDENFLWKPERIQKIDEITNENYTVIGTKHRPPMFSDYIEKVKNSRASISGSEFEQEKNSFMYPDII